MTEETKQRRRPWSWWIAGVVAGLFAIYLVVGFFVVPPVVKSRLISAVAEYTGITPGVGRVRFHPLRWRLSIEDFDLTEPGAGEPLFAFERLVIDADGPGFLRADVALDELLLVRPSIDPRIDASGRLNLLRVLGGAGQGPDAKEEAASGSGAEAEEVASESEGAEAGDEASEPLVVDVASIRIEQGRVHFSDDSSARPFDVTVDPLELEVDGFTTRPGQSAPVRVTLRQGEAAELRWQGTLGTDPIESQGHVELDALALALPWRYLSDKLRFEVADGRLGIEADYVLTFDDALSVAVEKGGITIGDLRVLDRADGSEVLGLPKLEVRGIAADVAGARLERLSISEVAAKAARLAPGGVADGALRLVELLRPEASSPDEGAQPPKASPASPSPSEAPAQAAAPAPEIAVDRIAFEDCEIALEDQAAPGTVELRIAPLDLELRGYRSEPGTAVDVDLAATLESGGELAVKGPVRIEPLDAKLRVEAQRVGLAAFEGYLQDVARLEIADGQLSSAIELDLSRGARDAPIDVSARGRVQLDGLETRDRAAGREFLRLESLRLEGLDYATGRIALEDVALEGARAALALDAKGRSNVEAIFGSEGSEASPSAPTEAAASEAAPLAVRVDRVSVADSRVDFSDRSTEPDVAIALDAISGTLEGLSSASGQRARVDVSGRLDASAPVRLRGEIAPLGKPRFGDLELTLENVSLPSLSPYAARYVGYTLDRGSLDFELDYRLKRRHVDATSHIVLDRVELGEKVKGSRSASPLPMPVALAVLRDTSGRIDLRIPISGSLDDAAFTLFGTLGRSVLNLVTKAALSPLALIPLPGGGDASQIRFAPGSDELSPEARQALEAIADALARKPSLRLDIRGQAAPDADGAALRRALVEQALRRRAFDALSARERRRLGGPENLELDEARRRTLLEALYEERVGSERTGAPERPASGEAPAETTPGDVAGGADARLAAVARTFEVDDEALRALARSRAEAIQAALLADSRLQPDQISFRAVAIDARAGEGGVPTELSVDTR